MCGCSSFQCGSSTGLGFLDGRKNLSLAVTEGFSLNQKVLDCFWLPSIAPCIVHFIITSMKLWKHYGSWQLGATCC